MSDPCFDICRDLILYKCVRVNWAADLDIESKFSMFVFFHHSVFVLETLKTFLRTRINYYQAFLPHSHSLKLKLLWWLPLIANRVKCQTEAHHDYITWWDKFYHTCEGGGQVGWTDTWIAIQNMLSIRINYCSIPRDMDRYFLLELFNSFYSVSEKWLSPLIHIVFLSR